MIRVLDFKNSKAGPRPFSSGSEGERLDFLSGVQKKTIKKLEMLFFLLTHKCILGNCKTNKETEKYFHYKAYILDTTEFQFKELEQ